MHRVVRPLIFAALVCVCAVAPALAASGPKRGYYIDPKLQTYIITTKDISHIKSFQTACIFKGGQSGSFVLSKKIAIKSDGSFKYTGNAKIYNGAPKPSIGPVTITAKFKNGKYKGTATFPQASGCDAANFSAKYYGVNPQG